MAGNLGWSPRFHAWLLVRFNSLYEPHVAPRKRALFGDLRGEVLEIGPGTGPNLAYYRSEIHWIGVEPNPFLQIHLREQARRLGRPIELRPGKAERLEAEDQSMDAVVSTLVLCSVDDVPGVLREILRVLRPGGRFYFVEHVAARQRWGRLLQRLLGPLIQLIGDGCHPDRETWAAIESAGFDCVRLEHFRVPIPIFAPHIAGVARKKLTP